MEDSQRGRDGRREDGRRWRRLGTGEGPSSARRRAGRLLHFLAPSRRRRAWERAPRAAPPWISSEREGQRSRGPREGGREGDGRESVKTGIADEDASVALDDKSGTKMTRSRKLEDENGRFRS